MTVPRKSSYMFTVAVGQSYCVYRHVRFQHVNERLYPGLEHCWGRWSIVVWLRENQNLKCRMCLERIANGAPRFVVYLLEKPRKIQFNEAVVFFEGVSECKDFSVTNLQLQALQTTVFAQPIRENGRVNITKNDLGRTLAASKDLYQSTCSSTRKFTAIQIDLEVWPRTCPVTSTA
jgi:hypothetical protein